MSLGQLRRTDTAEQADTQLTVRDHFIIAAATALPPPLSFKGDVSKQQAHEEWLDRLNGMVDTMMEARKP